MMWYVYILYCANNTLYCGITNNIKHRLKAHNSGKAARYTRGRLPVYLAAYWQFGNNSLAAKEEYRIKQLLRKEKLEMIQQWCESTDNFMIKI